MGLCSIKFCEVASEHGGTLMMRGLVPVEGTTTKASLNEGEQRLDFKSENIWCFTNNGKFIKKDTLRPQVPHEIHEGFFQPPKRWGENNP